MNALTQDYEDEIDMVLAYHGGDTRAALEAILKDRDFLAREVEIASMAVSYGYTRGWIPGAAR